MHVGAVMQYMHLHQDGLYMAVAAIEPEFFRNMLQGLGMSVADVPDPTNPRYSVTGCTSLHLKFLKSKL